MEEGVVVRKVLGYNGHHRLEKFSNLLPHLSIRTKSCSQSDVPLSLTSITGTKQNVLQGQTAQENEMSHKICGEEKGGGIDYKRYGAKIVACPYIVPPAERECTEMEAKVKACRALLGKSTGIRIGVTLKAFKEGQHSKFEHELDRMIQNEQEMHNIRENASRKWMNKRRKEINDDIANSHDLNKSMELFTKWVTYTNLSEKQQQHFRLRQQLVIKQRAIMEDFYSFIRPLLQNCYFLPEHRKQEIEELTMAFKKYDNLKLCHFRLFHAINLPQTRLRELGVDEVHIRTSHKTNSRPRRNSYNETETQFREEKSTKKEDELHILSTSPPRKRQRFNDNVYEVIDIITYKNEKMCFAKHDGESSDTKSNSLESFIVVNPITHMKVNSLEFVCTNNVIDNEKLSNTSHGQGKSLLDGSEKDADSLRKDINDNIDPFIHVKNSENIHDKQNKFYFSQTFTTNYDDVVSDYNSSNNVNWNSNNDDNASKEEDEETMYDRQKPCSDPLSPLTQGLLTANQVTIPYSLSRQCVINNHNNDDSSSNKSLLKENTGKGFHCDITNDLDDNGLKQKEKFVSTMENLSHFSKVSVEQNSDIYPKDEPQSIEKYCTELETLNQSLEKLLKSVNQDQAFDM